MQLIQELLLGLQGLCRGKNEFVIASIYNGCYKYYHVYEHFKYLRN